MNFWRKVYYKFRIGMFLTTIDRLLWKPYKVMNAKETVDFIVENSCSIARFGDGEMSIAAYGCGLGFQKPDVRLQQSLIDVMRSTEPNLLLCLPPWAGWEDLMSKEKLKNLGPVHQRGIERNLHDWIKYFPKNRLYGDANISRVTDTENFKTRREQIEYTKKIWKKRNVILIEGSKTRFGVGNDLLEDAVSISRILGPAESAFDFLQELLDACVTECAKHPIPLVLLALGPTATVMAWELQRRGIQAVDIGHLDIVYEVSIFNSLNGKDEQEIPVPRKHAIPGKYTNEAVGGNIVGACEDPEYLAQIVYSCEV